MSKIPTDKWKKYLKVAEVIKISMIGLTNVPIDQETKNLYVVMFEELLHKSPELHSGYISPAGRAQKSKKKPNGQYYKHTSDHFRGRRASAGLIFDKAIKGASVKRLALIIAWSCQVHWISKEENMMLRKVASNNPLKSMRQVEREYNLAGITLELYIPIISRKYDYHIEGVIYTSVKKIKELFDLSDAGIFYRCETKNYPDWQKVKIA
jgi:hypothetical protein